MLCYHFCDKIFLDELRFKSIIFPVSGYLDIINNRTNAYRYLYDKLEVSSLFFAWKDKSNKNSEIKYSENGDFILLTLDVPENEYILTDYYNWCDVIFCLDEKNTLNDAEYIAQKEMKCTFQTVYNSIFDINKDRVIQVLLKSIKYDWILNIEFVNNKVI